MIEQIITASVLIVSVWGISALFEKRVDPCIRYALWLLVAVKLLIPLPAFESAISVMNVVSRIGEPAIQRLFPADGNAGASDRPGESGRTSGAAEAETAPVPAMGGVSGETGQMQTAGAGGEIMPSFAEPAGKADIAGKAAEYLRSTDFAGFCKYVWMIGVAVCAAVLVWNNLRFLKGLKKRRIRIGRLKSGISVYRVAGIRSPFLYGMFKPSIYLQEGGSLSKEQCKFVLAHEYTHYRHGDHIWAFVRSGCVALYWYHPLVWLAAYRSMKDCELACDAGTLRRIGEERYAEYGKTLIETAKGMRKENPGPRVLECSAGAAGGAAEMKKRIRMLVKRPRTAPAAVLVLALLCIGAAGCTFGGAAGRTDSKETVGVKDGRNVRADGEGENLAAAGNGEDAAGNEGDRSAPAAETEGGGNTPVGEITGEESGTWTEEENAVRDPEGMVYGEAVLTQKEDPEKVCIRVEPSVLRNAGYYYYIPEGGDQEWMRQFMDNLPAMDRTEAKSLQNRKETGWQIVYQDKVYMAFEGGDLYYSEIDGQGMKEYFVEAPKLCDYVRIMLLEKMDYGRFGPDDITDIVSAKLDACGMFTGQKLYSQTVTDRETLELLENWLGNAEYILGGASCGNENACLELVRADGEILRLSVATDSCSNFGIDGIYYDYRPESVWDNREFFALFPDIPRE